MPSKTPEGAQRRDSFSAYPESVYIIGIDHGDENHILYDERITRPLDPTYVAMIVRHGVEVVPTVNARVYDGKIEVVNGRQRVRHAREANKVRQENGFPPIKIKIDLTQGGEPVLAVQQIALNMASAPTPREMGIHAIKLIRQGCSLSDIAATLGGVAESTVKRWLRLAESNPNATPHKKPGRKPDSMMPIVKIRGLHLKWSDAADEEVVESYASGYRDALEEVLMLNAQKEETPDDMENDMFGKIQREGESIESEQCDAAPEGKEVQP